MTPRRGDGPDPIASSFLISNLHCPTCVTTINDALQTCPSAQHVRWVSPNLVTSVLTVEHDPVLTTGAVEATLVGFGFDICATSTSAACEVADQGGRWVSASVKEGPTKGEAGPAYAQVRNFASTNADNETNLGTRNEHTDIHLQNCGRCRTFGPYSSPDEKRGWHEIVKYHLPSGSKGIPKAGHPNQSPVDQNTTVHSLATAQETQTRAKRQVILAIGGMTCGVCVNNITDELEKRPWTRRIVVSLVTNSAAIDIDDENVIPQILEAVEDLGYDAVVDNIIDLHQGKGTGVARERTVEILLQGTYCPRCPDRAMKSLEGFRRQVQSSNSQPLDPKQQRVSVVKVKYIPDAPHFTIRQILAAVEASDPALSISIYQAPTLEERSTQFQRQHQLQILYRLVLTGAVAIPTFAIGIVYMSLVPNDNEGKQYLVAPWVSAITRGEIALFVLATLVYFFAADHFHVRAFKEIKALWRRGSEVAVLRRFYRFGSMNTLMSLGTSIAYISSVAELIVAGVNRPHNYVTNLIFYFDSVVFLTFFVLIGRLIESFSRAKTGDAVAVLGKLRPTTAILVERYKTGKEKSSIVEAALLDLGDVVRVPHGASPPADGTLLEGETKFDESSLTGESRPVKKGVSDEVFAGTVNVGATPVLVQIHGVAGNSMLDQIVNVVREGQMKRAPAERVADIMTGYFVPVITFLAISTWLIWLAVALGGQIPDEWSEVKKTGGIVWSLQFAIAVFVVACPCGLALAAPTAIFVGGGLAARHGILAKGGGEAFEKASNIDCVVFDKTGTLTVGEEPRITDWEIFSQDEAVDENHQTRVLAALKTVEENSVHPIAKAIVAFCASKIADSASIQDLEEIPGQGLKAKCHDADTESSLELIVGNETLMAKFSVKICAPVATCVQRWKGEAKSIALVATRLTSPHSDTRTPTYSLAAAFSISDAVRPEASAVIHALQSSGKAVWLLSGDNQTTAAAVASRLGIQPENVIAGVLPAQKAEKITYLQSSLKARTGSKSESITERATVAMVGDGINDAPALATADVGIAIGSGADVAISSADFVVVNADLNGVLNIVNLSSAVFRRIKFNFAWAVVYNCIAIPVAAGCLYPIVSHGHHVRLDPVWASLAMALSSVSVVTSSLALRTRVPLIGYRPKRA
ncbi:heavy metal translocatin [Hortaea werneckii]|nr:heavy metal translocatin [Hortaea werneckii]